jgi:hypothetical protein
MRFVARSALLLTFSLALLMWGMALDTWRPGSFYLDWFAYVSMTLGALGLVGIILAAVRRDPSGAVPGWVRLGVMGLTLVVFGALAGFAALAYKGRSPDFVQFLNLRRTTPFNREVARGADGTYEMKMIHGNEISIERSQYPLDVLPSHSEMEAAMELVNRTKAQASKFENYDAVRASGGFSISTAKLSKNDGVKFEHLVNPEFMMDGKTLDPERPECLVFHREPAGQKRLVGIMYMTTRPNHGPQVGGPLTRWHFHPRVDFCMDQYGVPRASRQDNGDCPAGLNYGPSSEMLHVWLVDNPYGVFAHMMAVEPSGSSPAGPPGDHAHHH